MIKFNERNLSEYTLYIFDFDLTLADTRRTAELAYKSAFAACGAYYDNNKLFDFLSESLEMTYSKIQHPSIGVKEFIHIFDKKIHEYIQTTTALYQDAIDFISMLLGKGKELAIVTNKDRESIQMILKKYKLSDLFLSLVCAEDVVNKKPNKEPIANCLRETNHLPTEAVYFGDALNDLICAQNAGVDFIYVNRYKQELPFENSVVEIESFNDIVLNS